ncbi:hypothetical protein Mapa_001010 [Marchantia paleacea]|nr:hypothetical protein Mapa_001010 [Marchantia paleacea]
MSAGNLANLPLTPRRLLVKMSNLFTCLVFGAQLIILFPFVDAYGQYLYANEWLADGNSIRYFPVGYNRYDLTMQSNCDFLYSNPLGVTLWRSHTDGKGTASECYVIMQEDCNLVMYPDKNSGPGYGLPALWSTGTYGQGEGCYLWLGLYDGIIMGAVFDRYSNILWSTNSE